MNKKNIINIVPNKSIIEDINDISQYSYIKSANRPKTFILPVSLVYLTLPYKDPNTLSWSMEVNEYKLSISSGINTDINKPYGLPYGANARKLIYLICTIARTTENPNIHLGNSYTDVFKKLGISNTRAGGKNIKAFKDQIERLLNSRIELSTAVAKNDTSSLKGYYKKQALNLAKEMEFFQDKQNKFDFNIQLTNDFFEYIMMNKLIPFDYDILNLLDSSPMLMDLYIFLNYKAYTASRYKKDVFVSYQELFKAFGTISTFYKFKENLKNNLKKLVQVHKGLLVIDNGVSNGMEGIMVSKHSQSNVQDKELEQLEMFIDQNTKAE